MTGFEPAISSTQNTRDTKLRYIPFSISLAPPIRRSQRGNSLYHLVQLSFASSPMAARGSFGGKDWTEGWAS